MTREPLVGVPQGHKRFCHGDLNDRDRRSGSGLRTDDVPLSRVPSHPPQPCPRAARIRPGRPGIRRPPAGANASRTPGRTDPSRPQDGATPLPARAAAIPGAPSSGPGNQPATRLRPEHAAPAGAAPRSCRKSPPAPRRPRHRPHVPNARPAPPGARRHRPTSRAENTAVMPLILVTSPKGGVGKTTLTAHIAAILVKHGQRVLALDLDPQNALRLHLGMSIRDEAGYANALDQQPRWQATVVETPAGVRLLPIRQQRARRGAGDGHGPARPARAADRPSAGDAGGPGVVRGSSIRRRVPRPHCWRWRRWRT